MAFPVASQEMILVDFPGGMPQADGWKWEYFSDRVMGGRSDLVPPAITGAGADQALRLSGKVDTRGGGFLLARIRHERGPVDASAYKGVEVTIEAPAGGSYFLHLRTADTRAPWSCYDAPLEWPGGKTTLRVPWSSFKGENTGRRIIRLEALQSVALVAAWKDFQADLLIYRLSYYLAGGRARGPRLGCPAGCSPADIPVPRCRWSPCPSSTSLLRRNGRARRRADRRADNRSWAAARRSPRCRQGRIGRSSRAASAPP